MQNREIRPPSAVAFCIPWVISCHRLPTRAMLVVYVYTVLLYRTVCHYVRVQQVV